MQAKQCCWHTVLRRWVGCEDNDDTLSTLYQDDSSVKNMLHIESFLSLSADEIMATTQ